MQISRYLLCFLSITVLQAVSCQPAFSDDRHTLDNPDYSVSAWQPDAGATLNTRFDALIKSFATNPSTNNNHAVTCKVWKVLYKNTHSTCGQSEQKMLGARSSELTALMDTESAAVSAQAVSPGLTGTNWESALINGLADFLAERSKAEMRAWVTQQALDELCQEKNRPYFPTTCLYRETYQYGSAAMEGLIVKGFRADLKGLPGYLIWKAGKDSDQRDNDWGYVMTNYFLSLRSGDYPLYLTAGLSRTPAIVNQLEQNHIECTKIPISCLMYWSGLFSQAYYWSTHAQNNQANAVTTAGFLAALYVVLHDAGRDDLVTAMSQGLTKPFSSRQQAKALLASLRQKLVVLSDLERQINAEITTIRQAQTANKTDAILNGAAQLTELTVQLTVTLDGFLDSTGLMDTQTYNKLKPDLVQIRQVAHIAGYISSGNYSAAFGDFAVVVNCLAGTLGKDYCGNWQVDEKSKPVILAISANLPVIISLADAKSAQDVKNVLDNVASPVGSWRLKQKHKMTSITSLVGFQASRETLSGTGITSYTGYSGGMLAPLGLDMSWPTDGQHGSQGVLFSVLDFGNLVSARFTKKSTDQVADTQEDVKIKDILSIGLYYHRSFTDSPLMWGLGVSYTPNLRRADLVNNGQADVNSTRVSAFLAIDLTLYPL